MRGSTLTSRTKFTALAAAAREANHDIVKLLLDQSPRGMELAALRTRRAKRNVERPVLFGRMSAKQAAIAIANKTARIAWAIMVHGGVYEAGHRAPQYRAEACAAAEGLAMG